MGLLAVRKGDDPFQLARNFVKTFKLRPQLVAEIVDKIQVQIVNHYLERGAVRDSPVKPLPDGTAITVVSSTNPADDDFVYDEQPEEAQDGEAEDDDGDAFDDEEDDEDADDDDNDQDGGEQATVCLELCLRW